ncbi:MAG: cation diffusion facilitator family transporter [Acidobacteria bacterium]|nr:cation diffusion facilitator family transporter [Acidobacteriota bacterium]
MSNSEQDIPVAAVREAGDRAHAREALLKSSAARLSILAAASLIVIKAGAGWKTGSISVWASLLDSSMDIIASTINFFAVRAAARPPDEDHAYGHGKAESLAGLFQAAVITVSGLFLVWEAFKRLVEPRATTAEGFGVAAMLAAVLVSAGLVFRLRAIARRTDSPALAADAAHYASDIYSNGAALAALVVIALTGWGAADPVFSLAISIYILASAFGVARESVDVLMDKRLPPEIDELVHEIAARFRPLGVIGAHDLRTRRSGSLKFIDMHLEVDRSKTLEEAHDATVAVIRAIESEIPRARVQIHTDPT